MIDRYPTFRSHIVPPILALSAILGGCTGADRTTTSVETSSTVAQPQPYSTESLGSVPNPQNQAWFPVTGQLAEVFEVTAHAEIIDHEVVPGKDSVRRSVDITCVEAIEDPSIGTPTSHQVELLMQAMLGQSLYSPFTPDEEDQRIPNKQIGDVEYRVYQRQPILSSSETEALAGELAADIIARNKPGDATQPGHYRLPKFCLTSITPQGEPTFTPDEPTTTRPILQN